MGHMKFVRVESHEYVQRISSATSYTSLKNY